MQELGPVTEGSFYLPNRNWSCKWGFESLPDRQLDCGGEIYIITRRGGEVETHLAHNQENAGAIPACATKFTMRP